jgi:hypothetical protein
LIGLIPFSEEDRKTLDSEIRKWSMNELSLDYFVEQTARYHHQIQYDYFKEAKKHDLGRAYFCVLAGLVVEILRPKISEEVNRYTKYLMHTYTIEEYLEEKNGGTDKRCK